MSNISGKWLVPTKRRCLPNSLTFVLANQWKHKCSKISQRLVPYMLCVNIMHGKVTVVWKFTCLHFSVYSHVFTLGINDLCIQPACTCACLHVTVSWHDKIRQVFCDTGCWWKWIFFSFPFQISYVHFLACFLFLYFWGYWVISKYFLSDIFPIWSYWRYLHCSWWAETKSRFVSFLLLLFCFLII